MVAVSLKGDGASGGDAFSAHALKQRTEIKSVVRMAGRIVVEWIVMTL
jgi:hypothetical protein